MTSTNPTVAEFVKEQAQEQERKPDMINHPPHYNQGGIEHVDTVLAWGLDYLIGNCTKYLCRAGKKEGNAELQDLKKASWYLNKRIEVVERRQAKEGV